MREFLLFLLVSCRDEPGKFILRWAAPWWTAGHTPAALPTTPIPAAATTATWLLHLPLLSAQRWVPILLPATTAPPTTKHAHIRHPDCRGRVPAAHSAGLESFLTCCLCVLPHVCQQWICLLCQCLLQSEAAAAVPATVPAAPAVLLLHPPAGAGDQSVHSTEAPKSVGNHKLSWQETPATLPIPAAAAHLLL